MKITQVNSKKVKAYEIKVGECFETDGTIYMRLDHNEFVNSPSGCNREYSVVSVDFKRNHVTFFLGTADVTPVNSELKISYK